MTKEGILCIIVYVCQYWERKVGGFTMADERVTDLQLAHSVLGYTGVPGAYAYEVLQNVLSKYIKGRLRGGATD